MTAPELNLLDALAQVVGADHLAQVRSWPRTYDPAADFDEDTLRRSFGLGLSKSARREQRRPLPFVPDESGYLPSGSWTPGGEAA